MRFQNIFLNIDQIFFFHAIIWINVEKMMYDPIQP